MDELREGILSRYMSITGQEINLGLDGGFQGRFQFVILLFKYQTLISYTGQCISVKSFEQLNQLGEGSKS